MYQKIIAPSSLLIKSTLNHPFYTELFQRKLSEPALKYYLSQDMIYLEALGVLLPQISARLNSPEDKLVFDQLTPSTIQAEAKTRSLFSIPRPKVISPVIKAYLAHLAAYAQHPELAVAMAAHLACPLLYKKAGELINAAELEDKSCEQSVLLKSYICPNFHRATDQAMEIMLKQIDPTDEESIIPEMTKAMMISLTFEREFGHECYYSGKRFNNLTLTAAPDSLPASACGRRV